MRNNEEKKMAFSPCQLILYHCKYTHFGILYLVLILFLPGEHYFYDMAKSTKLGKQFLYGAGFMHRNVVMLKQEIISLYFSSFKLKPKSAQKWVDNSASQQFENGKIQFLLSWSFHFHGFQLLSVWYNCTLNMFAFWTKALKMLPWSLETRDGYYFFSNSSYLINC